MMQTRGAEWACASSAASRYDGPGRTLNASGPSGRKPMLVAMIVGCDALTSAGKDLWIDDVQRPGTRHQAAQILGDGLGVVRLCVVGGPTDVRGQHHLWELGQRVVGGKE